MLRGKIRINPISALATLITIWQRSTHIITRFGGERPTGVSVAAQLAPNGCDADFLDNKGGGSFDTTMEEDKSDNEDNSAKETHHDNLVEPAPTLTG